jgi:GntR family transcriptional regulator
MLTIEINHKKGLPIYLQIIEQIKHLIATGKLSIGDQLPTVRMLAVQLSINVNTVAKAYTELEWTGIVETRQGIGTFVKKQEAVLTAEERAKKLRFITSKFLDEALMYRYSIQEIKTVIEELVNEMSSRN